MKNLLTAQENTETLLIDVSSLDTALPDLNPKLRDAILKVKTMKIDEPSAHTNHASHSSHSVHGTIAW